MIDLKNVKRKQVGYWEPKLNAFVPNQNADGTLREYSTEQIREMISSGIVTSSADGSPIVVPRPAPTAEQKQEDYEQTVNRLIRSKYTLSQELAIIRQQSTKSEEYQAYFDYCEECKAKARAEVYGNEI